MRPPFPKDDDSIKNVSKTVWMNMMPRPLRCLHHPLLVTCLVPELTYAEQKCLQSSSSFTLLFGFSKLLLGKFFQPHMWVDMHYTSH